MASLLEQLLLIDASLHQWVIAHQTPLLDPAMLAFSAIGAKAGVWLSIGALLFARRPRLAPGVWQLVLALVLTGLLTEVVMKPAVQRVRPFARDGAVRVVGTLPATFSFPSGHAATSFAGTFVLTRIVARGHLAFWLLAAIISFSRVYIGVHYPLDVLVGALVGLGVGVLVTGRTTWYSLGSGERIPAVPR